MRDSQTMKNKSRAKKKKAGDHGGPMIKFDARARQVYLTGFTKRKEKRRWVAQGELLEKARQDKIEARKDIRTQVKNNWNEMQYAQALTNKALARLGLEDTPDCDVFHLEDSARNEAIEDKARPKAPVTVGFEREEDDPFGDCEVTTTAFNAPNTPGGSADNAAKLWPALLHTNISAAWERGAWDPENADADEVAAEKFARQRRRAVVKKKEEDRQRRAHDRNITKHLGMKQRAHVKRGGHSKATGKEGKKKSKAGDRRKRKGK